MSFSRSSWAVLLSVALLAAVTSSAHAQELLAPPNTRIKPLSAAPQSAHPGALVWEDQYDVSSFEQAFSVATLRGRAFVAGFVAGVGRDFVVRAYDSATGTLAWQDRVNNGSDEFASGVAVDATRVFVSGAAFRPGRSYAWMLRAYDAETGRLLWEASFDLPDRSDIPRGTALAAGGGLVFLGGTSTGGGDRDSVVRAYDAASGELVWHERLTSGDTGAYALTFSSGRLFVGGWRSDSTAQRAAVRAYDASSGVLQWEHLVAGAPGFGQTWTSHVMVQGDRVIAGQPRRALVAPFDLVPHVLALDTHTGVELWSHAFHPEGGFRWLYDVGASGGRVFAVGYGGVNCATTESNCNALIDSYDVETGAVVWTRENDLSGEDDQASLVKAERGVVYVQSDAQATLDLPNCCIIGQMVVQAFGIADGQLLWQAVEQRGESGVYNMAVDRERLIIPGRTVNTTTGDWNFSVHAYDVRGRASELESLFAIPTELSLSGAAGTLSYDITFDNQVTASAYGLLPASEQAGHVVDDPDNTFNAGAGVGETTHSVPVPVGTTHLRVALFDSDTDGNHDLDLYVYAPNGQFVAGSGGLTATEHVDIANPQAGAYLVVVHGYDTDGPDANYTLFSWAIPPVASGNLQVSGPTPSTGPSGTVTLNWSGLLPTVRYFGVVSYSDGTFEIGRTLLSARP